MSTMSGWRLGNFDRPPWTGTLPGPPYTYSVVSICLLPDRSVSPSDSTSHAGSSRSEGSPSNRSVPDSSTCSCHSQGEAKGSRRLPTVVGTDACTLVQRPSRVVRALPAIASGTCPIAGRHRGTLQRTADRTIDSVASTICVSASVDSLAGGLGGDVRVCYVM